MNPSATFRPATRRDSRKIAELFGIASGGVAEYLWSSLVSEYPGLAPIEIGAMRYAREKGPFSYKNCTLAELGGAAGRMPHAFPMEEPQEEGAGEEGSPILEFHAMLV